MQQQLAEIVNELESAQARLHRLADNLPNARWKSRPRPERWSAAECVEHLNLTSRAYIPLLRRALESATKAAVPPGHHRRDFLGWLFWKMVGPLWTIGKRRIGRVKTAGDFVPQITPDRIEALAEFDRLQDDLIAITRQAEYYHLSDIKIVSPFGGRIRYNAYSALHILPRHQDRHLGQAEEAVQDPTL
ncbi:MAG TPA: DinB family protein [Gemmatimonadaceae bacterium]|nr:DinB family protein [Gemmatimonadaceae bacterium]